MKQLYRHLFILTLALLFTISADAQNFLHRSGKYIYDGNNQEVILHGIGTGNWMIQEGYMMQTNSVANTQHRFEARLRNQIGDALTDSFYNVWLHSHMRQVDVDSMKAWGFNSIRVNMHYKWFTLPIEKEPVAGENTWIDTGFELLDSLLSWCTKDSVYLILDLHAAPGGQGKDSAISDYDPSRFSLWESSANKNKTIALWRRIAEHYSKESWIGGYDLINETNWTFPEGNNTQLKQLFVNITNAIREVDTNHLIFIEGNSFANDFSGLTPAWDDNMAYSFHKYWTYNDAGSLDWVINLRNSQNVPLWLGETGENSNSWYATLASLCEKNHIGWSWWPIKKPGINNPLKVEVNSEYTDLINYWGRTGAAPDTATAFNAVLQFALNQKLENCSYQKDVVDALIRQPITNDTKPFTHAVTGKPVYSAQYDLGRCGIAYYDTDTADYHGSQSGTYTTWNSGWAYRNDGVDIEGCNDADSTCGYNVGWTNTGEWMQYTIQCDSTAGYTLSVRSASGSSGSKIHLEENGVPLSGKISLAGTGGWQNWKTTTTEGLILSKGAHRIRFFFDQGGSNLNYFMLSNPVSTDSVPFTYLMAATSTDGAKIYLTLNKDVTTDPASINLTDFSVLVDNVPAAIQAVETDSTNAGTLTLRMSEKLYYGAKIYLSYSGQSVASGNKALNAFTKVEVINKLPIRYNIPSRIQAESCYVNQGFSWETCTDAGGGLNTSYANAGDYLDFNVYVPTEKSYMINYRVATIRTNADIMVLIDAGGSFVAIDTFRFTSTGAWQTWQTQSTKIHLPAGRYTLRLQDKQGEFNLNWFDFSTVTGILNSVGLDQVQVYPNPAQDYLHVDISGKKGEKIKIRMLDILGRQVYQSENFYDEPLEINTSAMPKGLYFLVIETVTGSQSRKVQID